MAAGNPRTYGALRTVLIGYGTIVAAYLMPRSDEAAGPSGLGDFASASGLMIAGVVVQIVLLLAHALIRRRVGDAQIAAQFSALTELVGDAATVLLFALGTLGPILAMQSSF